MQGRIEQRWGAGALVLTLLAGTIACTSPEPNVPGETWARRDSVELGLDPRRLEELATALGGHGMVVVDGQSVKEWGAPSRRFDVFSVAKPVFATLLFFAVQEGRVSGTHAPVSDFGWDLREEDRGMTLAQLASMTSGYARPEPPGAAFAYNDYAVQLYQKTLFDRLYAEDPASVANAPSRLGALQLRDGLEFDDDRRRLLLTLRDKARIALFWLNRGRWGERQLLPQRYFDEAMRPHVPADLPHTDPASTDDYLGVGSFGGDSDHYTTDGPGIYGYGWWFNTTGRDHPDRRTWPDAPADMIVAKGVRGSVVALFPSQNALLVTARSDWGTLAAGDSESIMNRRLSLAAAAVTREEPSASSAGVELSGELRRWHRVTLTFEGPEASEEGDPNPFLDYRLDVTFRQRDRSVVVPGFFAADGDAANSGATEGNRWRVHFLPDAQEAWSWRASFRRGPRVALADDPLAGSPVGFDGAEGRFRVQPSDKTGRDHRARGLLQYVGQRYLRFAGTGEWFLKGGANSPENLLAFADFDGTPPTHRYEPHVADFREGDPTWKGARGRGLLGALRYLAGKGMNAVYFLSMNVGGDGDDVWPWTRRDETSRFDTSKLDQWEIVFSHMDRLGLLLHVVTQETENDQLLDAGELGPMRRLYYRELVARYAHHPALVWNLGEENTNTDDQRRDFAAHLRALDPYDHPITLHTHPKKLNAVYTPLLGNAHFEGASLQTQRARRDTRRWIERSAQAGRPWVVTLDEIGPAEEGAPPDGEERHAVLRRKYLWPSLMEGGAGVEWYFGYGFPHDDLNLENWRSRDRLWDQTRHALAFFVEYLPFSEFEPCSERLSGAPGQCFGEPGVAFAVYLPDGGEARLDLGEDGGEWTVHWYDPRRGGELREGSVTRVRGRAPQVLGLPPESPDADWVALLRPARRD